MCKPLQERQRSWPSAIPSQTDTAPPPTATTAGPTYSRRRLQASPDTRNIGVSNQGIGGNHLLTDGLGPNALARFDRDVLAPAGVRWVIVFEGVNDLGGLAREREVSTRRTRGPCKKHPVCLSANHCARPCPRPARLRSHHHSLCRFNLLSSRPAERVRPPNSQPMDSRPRPLRRCHRLRRHPPRPAKPRTPPAHLRLRRPPPPLPRRLQSHGQRRPPNPLRPLIRAMLATNLNKIVVGDF